MKKGLLYEFGPFRLEVSEHRLLRHQEIVSLSPKVFETLLVLVEQSGHVLEKDELMKRLWPDSFVEESSLTQNISLLRKALNENGEQQFIETVPKIGYRFIAPVEVVEGRRDSPPSPSETRPRISIQKLMLACGAALLLLSIAIVGIYLRQTKTPPPVNSAARVRSLAVLPLKPLSNGGDDQFLGLGVADALIVKLGNFEQFNVRPTSSVIKYAGHEFDSRSVGQELGVDTVLDGTIQHAGDRVRVTVMLLSTRDDQTLWSDKFDERFTDIFSLQDSISERVASVLQLQLASGKQAQLTKRFTENAEAYRDYTMGLYFWNKRTREGVTKAIEYFQKATEADHNYALAYAMLADSYCLTVFYAYDILPRDQAFLKAEAATARALELDDTTAEAYAVVGMIKAYDNDFPAAEQSYKRAIELNPNSSMTRYRYAFNQLSMLQIDAAIREMRRTQELDPLSLPINTTLAGCLIYVGQYDDAIKYSKVALEIEPQFGLARANLGEAYEWKGMHDEAAAEYKKLSGQQGFRLNGELGLAFVYARSGRRDDARRLMEELKSRFKSKEALVDIPLQIAGTYAMLGDTDNAFVWLEQAVESGNVHPFELRYSRQLNPLKDDPRYEQILRRHEYKEYIVAELSKQNLP